MLPNSKSIQRPQQARSIKTEQELLDALEKLLVHKSFADLTVAELATEAGLTTGAIYRRFGNKEGVLRAAFERFQDRTRLVHCTERPADLSDYQMIKGYLSHLMDFTFSNVHIMRAANSLNDIESFDRMNRGRSMGAEWLAENIRSSALPQKTLLQRCRFVLRVATATFRDTFLSGRGSVVIQDDDRMEYEAKLDRLCANLATMAERYLELRDGAQK